MKREVSSAALDLFAEPPREPARPLAAVSPATSEQSVVMRLGVTPPAYLHFALHWHDEVRFRTWLLGLRERAATGRSLVTFLDSAPDRLRRQPSGAYSAVVLLRAAVLADWVRARPVVEHFDPLNERVLQERSYILNEESEGLRRYLDGRPAAQTNTQREPRRAA